MTTSFQQSGKDAPRRAGVKRRILGPTVAKAIISRRATNLTFRTPSFYRLNAKCETSDEYRELFSK